MAGVIRLSPKAKRNIYRILPFGIIWFISGMVFFVVEWAAGTGSNGLPDSGIEMNVSVFLFGSLALTAVGLFVGAIEILYLNNALARKSFGRKIFYKFVIYLSVFFVVTLITYPVAVSLELGSGLFDRIVWDKLITYLGSSTHISTDLQLAVALGVSLFYAGISENIGHGILVNFFTGKYHSPKEEQRIFMFLDMKSSTAIAESLGHIRYFDLLRDYYDDLSDAIIRHEGEVYQYVGDEIVVTWKSGKGLRKNNCIRCFFAMQEDLRKKAGYYEKKYGTFPAFKAGLHTGSVTTGEIGSLKKEIIFTGDVLNATARIQALCNPYKVDFLVSGDLVHCLNPDPDIHITSLGKKELRGKKENLELYTVRYIDPRQ